MPSDRALRLQLLSRGPSRAIGACSEHVGGSSVGAQGLMRTKVTLVSLRGLRRELAGIGRTLK